MDLEGGGTKTQLNKIYQTELRLKEMISLKIIAKTNKTSFSNSYWYDGSGKLIAAVRVSNLKRSELWKSITKTIVAGGKQPLRGVSRK